jgi:23S rRNA-/tRNA-specific pseudouridylate synthase
VLSPSPQPPPDLEERVLFEAKGLLVVNKPPDLPSTGRSLDDSDCLQFWLIQRHGGMVWAVHQLDADTSGINVFTTEKKLVGQLKKRMRSPQGRKTYLALVHGRPSWTHRKVDAPIGFIDSRSLGVTEEGKTASSHFSVLHHTPEHALIEARILTGRTHQIRIHLSSLGHPLIGEEWYRSSPCLSHPRQALHAWKLDLAAGPGPCSFVAPLAPDLCKLAERVRLSLPTT